jgi:hypothetical protein
MQEKTLDALHGRSVTIDVCEPCQCFWFDGHEALQLAAPAVLSLFRLIGARADRPQVQDGDVTRCPGAAPACAARATCSGPPASSTSNARTSTAV